MIKAHTLGCRLNIQETECMVDMAKNAGVSNAVIINTCAVTREAERKSRQIIRSTKKKYPYFQVIVTGCAASIAREKFQHMSEVDVLITNEVKTKFSIWKSIAQSQPKFPHQHTINNLYPSEKTRAFVQVQNGCDHQCTFCVIPYGRGASRSIPDDKIIQMIKNHLSMGKREIILTGVDLTDYNGGLGVLIQKILMTIPDLERLRISSLDCFEIDNALLEVFSDDRIMPYIHLSLQSGNNLILKRMGRRNLREDALRLCDRLRSVRPDIVFGGDFIVGFPTETESMFQDTVSLVEECDISLLHVFPYSERPGTPAARMPQIAYPIRKKRAQILRQVGEKNKKKLYSNLLGKRARVLWEHTTKTGMYMGYTEHFVPVFSKGPIRIGSISSIQLKEIIPEGLVGHWDENNIEKQLQTPTIGF